MKEVNINGVVLNEHIEKTIGEWQSGLADVDINAIEECVSYVLNNPKEDPTDPSEASKRLQLVKSLLMIEERIELFKVKK